MSNINNDIELQVDIIKELTDFQNNSEADNFDYGQIDLSLFCETTLHTNCEDSIAASENPNRKHQLAVNEAFLNEGIQECPTNFSHGYPSSSQMDQSSIVTSWFSHGSQQVCTKDVLPATYMYPVPVAQSELYSSQQMHNTGVLPATYMYPVPVAQSELYSSQQIHNTGVLPATSMYPVPVAQSELYSSQQIHNTGVLPATSMYSFSLPTSCFLPSRSSVNPSLSTSSDQKPIDPLVKPPPLPSLHTSGASSAVQPEASLSSEQSTFTSGSVPTSNSTKVSIRKNQKESNRPRLKTCRSHKVTCPKCFIVLSSIKHLRQHIVSHNSVKPSGSFGFNAQYRMTCPTCGLVVATKGHLKQHIASHSTSSLNLCFKCNCTFTARAKLGNHLLRAHGLKLRYLRENLQG